MNNYTVESVTKVCVKPEYLQDGLADHLQKTVRSKLQNTWTEEAGFINSIDILPLKEPGLCNTRDGTVQFTVAYKAQALKPTLHQKVSAKIIAVTTLGINLEYGPLPIFVSNRLMGDYKFSKNCYRSPTRRSLAVGDNVDVEIIGFRWKGSAYDSVGALV